MKSRFSISSRAYAAVVAAQSVIFMQAPSASLAQALDAPSAARTVEIDAAPAAPAAMTRHQVEVGGGWADLTGGNKNWNDVYGRGFFRFDDKMVLHWSAAHQRHFGDSGATGAVTLVRDLTPNLYGMLGAAGGSAVFQNKVRLDAGLYYKWPDSRRWVTGISLMSARSGDDVHRDVAVRGTVIYYSPDAWVAEGGLIFNRSNPGRVWGTRGYAAVTFGSEKKHYLSLRLEHGREAYLPVGLVASYPGNVEFTSTEATIQWRQWVGRNWGYVAGAQFYRNPYYRRTGVTAGLFWDF